VFGFSDPIGPFDTIAPENVYAGYFQGNVSIQGNLQLAGVVEGTLGVQNGDLNVAGGNLNLSNDLNMAGTLTATNANIGGIVNAGGIEVGNLNSAGTVSAVITESTHSKTEVLFLEHETENDAVFQLVNDAHDAATGQNDYRGAPGGSEIVISSADTSGSDPTNNIGTDLSVSGRVHGINGVRVGAPAGEDRIPGNADDGVCAGEMSGTVVQRPGHPGLWVCLDVGAGLEWRRLD
jgi:hypothetical protein